VKLRRFLQMSVPELAGRGRQEARKRLERLGVVPHPSLAPERIFSQLSSDDDALAEIRAHARRGDIAGAAALLRDRFRDLAPRRFFPGASEDDVLLAPPVADTRGRLISAADSTCRGQFDLLGYRGLSFGVPPDWHLDPVSGRRAPAVHWSQIDPLDFRIVGDTKVVWELNRHQWLVTLGQAYRFTREECYAECFAAAVRDWLLANPPGIGINWTSSLEVALRLISWCWALVLFGPSPTLSPQLFLEVLAGLRAHALHIERYLSHYFSPNTHLTGEALGLVYAGVMLPELREAARWVARGARILEAESERQVLADGVYFEQSTCYQHYTLDTYLQFLVLARRNALTVQPTVAERVQRMLDFALAVRRPDGSVPQIGDADGGQLLALAAAGPEELRGVFSTGAAWFRRADYAWAGGSAPEMLWMLGKEGGAVVEALVPAPPSGAPSRLFEAGGYAIMRSGWDGSARQLVLDAGPLGCPVSGGHGHADLLSIQCSVGGDSYLVDPGTFGYTADASWRDHFRGTGAHSTVLVDGLGQADPAGPFRWRMRPAARVREWRSTEAMDFVDASHDAYRRLADPVTHRRRVLFVKPRFWIVVDDLDGAAEHTIEVGFQLAPMDVAMDARQWARARGRHGGALLVRAVASGPLKCELREGELTPVRGWVSDRYGERRPAPYLVYSVVTTLPVRIATLLWPVDEPSAPPPALAPITETGGELTGLVLGGNRETIRFVEPIFVVERG